MARTYQHLETTDQPTRAALIRWSSVFGGVVIGGALLLLLSTLWLALAAATGIDAIADGIGWFLAASAIVALFVGGWLAGALSGVPGIGPGIVNGLAVWGVILVLSAVVGTPGALNLAMAPGIDLPALDPGQTLWPAFWSLLISAVTAGAGGAIGGMTTRGAAVPVAAERRYEERYRERDERDWRDRDFGRDERDWSDRDRGRDERDWGDRDERDWRGRDRDEGLHRDEGAYRQDRPGDRDRYPDDRPPPAERAAPSERAYAERASARGEERPGEYRPGEHGR